MAKKKGVNKKHFYDIFLRYLFLIVIALPNLYIFYLVFKPLTAYPVYWLLKIFFDASLNLSNVGNYIILINNVIPIELINACIAGAAYYLLFILNLSTREIKLNQRIKMLFFAFLSLLIINIIRIVILSILAVSQTSIFDLTHKIFWYSLSTIFVLVIWFVEVKIFKIKNIPVYSDMKFLLKNINKSRK